MAGECYVDGLVGHDGGEVAGRPFFAGWPVAGTVADDKRSVAGGVAHEFQG